MMFLAYDGEKKELYLVSAENINDAIATAATEKTRAGSGSDGDGFSVIQLPEPDSYGAFSNSRGCFKMRFDIGGF